MISVERNVCDDWELRDSFVVSAARRINGDVILCTCDGRMSERQALNSFAANFPQYARAIDELLAKCPEDASDGAKKVPSGERARVGKPGSGRRFRELIGAGKTNAEALAIVKAEFPDSRATLSDAAWNRAKLQKEMAAAGMPLRPLVVVEDLL